MLRIGFFFALCSCLWSTVVYAAEFVAQVDRHDLPRDEHIVLTLTLTNSETRLRAEGIEPNIDFSVLTRDFVVGIPRATHRFNLQRAGGRSTSSLRVELFPRRTGRLSIPRFTLDGLKTLPLTVEVRPVVGLPEVYSKSGIAQRTLWVGQPLLAWLDIYRRVDLRTASLGGDVELTSQRVDVLEWRRLPSAERVETVQGMRYTVQRIAWVVFPQAGDITVQIPAVWIVTAQGRPLRVEGGQHAVRVQALPASVPPQTLIGAPQVTQSSWTGTPAVDNPLTYRITLRAPVSYAALPETLPLPSTADVKMQVEPARRDVEVSAQGVMAVAHYQVALIPSRAGEFAIPAWDLPYFDPESGRLAAVSIPSHHFNVPTPLTPTPVPTSVSSSLPQTLSTVTSRPPREQPFAGWRFLAIGFSALWLITVALWWRERRRRSGVRAPTTPAPALSPTTPTTAKACLLTALGSRTLEQGLAQWERIHGPDAMVRAAVRAVQEHAYSAVPPDAAHVDKLVEQAIAHMRHATPLATPVPDPWLPEAFTVRKIHGESCLANPS